MKDVLIKVYDNGQVFLPNNNLGYEGEHISRNIIVKMSNFIDGIAMLEIDPKKEVTDKYFLTMEKQNDTYILPIYESLLSAKELDMQLVVMMDEQIVFKSEVFTFKIGNSINAKDKEFLEEYASYITKIETKISEVDEVIKDLNQKVEEGYFKGEIGPQGPKGEDGTMTFEDLTPEQKVSLKGDTGEQGPQGNPGQDGKDGINGIDGVSPNITIKSNTDEEYVLEITDVNGVITTPNLKGSKGLDGINGTNGVDGKKGENGLTPTIGENGNWFIGTTDTGVLARGVNGTDGEKGEQGEPGQNGTDGINGINGEDGATFTPSVDENGNLSWTNNKGLENPPTINIKGQDGTNGINGADGVVDYTQVNAYIDEKIGNINNVLAMLVTVEESE